MNRRAGGLIGVAIGIVAGLIGFAAGIEIASSKWQANVAELGEVIAKKNAGVQLQAQDWPNDIDLIAAGTTDDKVTVYMGVAKDTEVDLEFEGERLVSISCRR